MRRWVGLSALFVACSLLILRQLPLVLINVSQSLPRGVYWRKNSSIAVGDIAVVCAESIASLTWITDRAYTGNGGCADGTAPLLKPVAAVGPGRIVETDSGVIINGQVIEGSKPLSWDSRGNPMPVLRGETYLASDQLYLLSTHHVLSLDSRYFGPVPERAIRMVVTPVLTEELLWTH